MARMSNSSTRGRDSLDRVEEILDGGAVGPARKGMILPFQPLAISFNDVNYYVDMPAVSLSAAAYNLFRCAQSINVSNGSLTV